MNHLTVFHCKNTHSSAHAHTHTNTMHSCTPYPAPCVDLPHTRTWRHMLMCALIHTHTHMQALFNSNVCLHWIITWQVGLKCVCPHNTDMLYWACKPVNHEGSKRLTPHLFQALCRSTCWVCELLWVKTFFHMTFYPHVRLEACNMVTATITVTM